MKAVVYDKSKALEVLVLTDDIYLMKPLKRCSILVKAMLGEKW